MQQDGNERSPMAERIDTLSSRAGTIGSGDTFMDNHEQQLLNVLDNLRGSTEQLDRMLNKMRGHLPEEAATRKDDVEPETVMGRLQASVERLHTLANRYNMQVEELRQIL